MPDAVYVTRPLLAALCELAADADPRPITVSLATAPAADLATPDHADLDAPTDPDALGDADGDDGTGNTGDVPILSLGEIDPDTPVFSEFYFPEAGDAVNRVFGVDLGTPAGQTQGRFLSHPKGDRGISLTDDLHARLLVAVPPWKIDAVRAYDRNGRRLDLVVVAAGRD